jgi:hypothetical protein
VRFLSLLFVLTLVTPPAWAVDKHGNWTNSGILKNCDYCRTEEFHQVRKKLAQQNGELYNAAAAAGYVVLKRKKSRGGFATAGRMVLMGTGRMATTDAHILFKKDGNLREGDDGKLYFTPMLHSEVLIEIDLSSIEAGVTTNISIVRNSKNDWANVYLKRDVFEVVNDDRLYALLWNHQLDHSAFNSDEYRADMNYIFSPENTLSVSENCSKVFDDHPDNYYFDSEQIFLVNCPYEISRKGASGSTFILNWSDGSKYFVGQIVSKESEVVADGPKGDGRKRIAPQIVTGLPPKRLESLNRMYIQELARRGINPLGRH